MEPFRLDACTFAQREEYQNTDLMHEEIVEIDSPFAYHAQSHVKTLTYLLVGDQNAGKSTFLHAFCSSTDAQWMRMLNALPILYSSFINYQYLNDDDDGAASVSSAAMDEEPFIDTDVACGAFCLSLDDFAFFLTEDCQITDQQQLQRLLSLNEDGRSMCSFVCIRLIEIGGDHLDRLIGFARALPHADDVAASHSPLTRAMYQSLDLLSQRAEKMAYFVNASQLFSSLSCNIEHLSLLFSRLLFLNQQQSMDKQDPLELLLYVSRVPQQMSNVLAASAIADAFAAAIALLPLPSSSSSSSSPLAFTFSPLIHENMYISSIYSLIKSFIDVYCPSLSLQANAFATNHVDASSSSLIVANLVKSLTRLICNEMTMKQQNSSSSSVASIVNYTLRVVLSIRLSLSLSSPSPSSLLLGTAALAHHLDDSPTTTLPVSNDASNRPPDVRFLATLSMPSPSVVAAFDRVASAAAAAGFALRLDELLRMRLTILLYDVNEKDKDCIKEVTFNLSQVYRQAAQDYDNEYRTTTTTTTTTTITTTTAFYTRDFNGSMKTTTNDDTSSIDTSSSMIRLPQSEDLVRNFADFAARSLSIGDDLAWWEAMASTTNVATVAARNVYERQLCEIRDELLRLLVADVVADAVTVATRERTLDIVCCSRMQKNYHRTLEFNNVGEYRIEFKVVNDE